MRNKLPYRSFSKFKSEFELKLSQVCLILNSREFEASKFDGILHVGRKCILEHLIFLHLLPNLHGFGINQMILGKLI
jgi:hypothetical protein